jgi:hypothetical protein
MLLLISIGLTTGALLASRRDGARPLWPLVGLVCVAAGALMGPAVGLAPLMGLLGAFQVEREKGYGQVLLAAALPPAALGLWMLLTAPSLPWQELTSELAGQMEALGLEIEEGSRLFEEAVKGVLRVLPAIQFLTLLLAFVLAYALSQRLGQWLQIALPSAPSLALWRPWEELIWVLVGALSLSLLGGGFVKDLGLNLAVVMLVLYAVQGLALLRFFARRLGLPRLVELFFYAGLILTAGLALGLLAGLGLLETWFDWRRLRLASPTREEA